MKEIEIEKLHTKWRKDNEGRCMERLKKLKRYVTQILFIEDPWGKKYFNFSWIVSALAVVVSVMALSMKE